MATSYEITSPSGRTVYATDTLDAARRYRTDRAARGINLRIVEVETRRRVLV